MDDLEYYLDIFKPYLEEPDNFMLDFVKHEINRLGLYDYLNYSIDTLDASKNVDGLRPVQTISYIYIRSITEIVHTILNYVESESIKKVYFDKLLERHNKNLEFEKDNPPIDYDADTRPKTKSKPKSKDNSVQRTPRRKDGELTAAQRKLINHAVKLNNLTFNIKH